MDRQQFIDKLSKAKGSLRLLVEASKGSTREEDWLNKTAMIDFWFEEVGNDFNSGLLPERFGDVVLGWISPFALDSDFFNRNSEDIKDSIDHGNVNDIIVNHRKVFSLNDATNERYSYHFYKQLNFAKSNAVVVGANGSGKTSLANTLSQTLQIENGIVIPAQKLLILPSFSSIPNFGRSLEEYKNYQHKILDDRRTYDVSREYDIPSDIMRDYGGEFKKIMSILLAEYVKSNNVFSRNYENTKNVDPTLLNCRLKKVFEIWNDLIGGRKLDIDVNNNLIVIPDEGEQYPAYRMSDGERIILYFAGRILLAPEHALIVVDEPEGYLHESIINKLWDKLENLRQDCVFIYLTHDLKFASSRCADKFWMKKFVYPNHWQIKPIPQDVIPEALMMEILGSRKKILFCEGNKIDSLDVKIYEAIFPDYTITPVESCNDVINYTRAYNKIPNRNSDAYGIVDRDFRDPAQIAKLQTEHIFATDVAEIENFFLNEDFIKAHMDYRHADTAKIDAIKDKVIDMLQANIDLQAANYVSAKINFYYSVANVSKGNNKDDVKAKYDAFNSKIKIDEWFNERKQYLENVIRNRDYESVIRVYNNKGLQGAVEQIMGYRSRLYRIKALEYLTKEQRPKDILRGLFPTL